MNLSTLYKTGQNKLFFIYLISNVVILSSFIFTFNSFGQIFNNPLKDEYNTLGAIVLAIVDGIVIILIPIMALAIVYIGFKMVVDSATKPEKLAEHKQSLLYALIGLGLVLGAKGIIEVIQNTVYSFLA